jgi:hypothetical protein
VVEFGCMEERMVGVCMRACMHTDSVGRSVPVMESIHEFERAVQIVWVRRWAIADLTLCGRLVCVFGC